MEDLSKLRQDIDRIDRKIVELFEERMGVSRQVAEYKIANGKKVLDRARELEKLETLGNLTNDSFNRHGIQELFQQIMAMSRKLQYQLLEENGVAGRLPFIGVDELEKENVRVVFQGQVGGQHVGIRPHIEAGDAAKPGQQPADGMLIKSRWRAG